MTNFTPTCDSQKPCSLGEDEVGSRKKTQKTRKKAAAKDKARASEETISMERLSYLWQVAKSQADKATKAKI